MNLPTSQFQIHKYKIGHQLISSTLVLDRQDQDTVDRMSDISGQIRPGEVFPPYFTCYPLPSQKYFVVARTWQDLFAPRAGCVYTKSIMLPMIEWESSNSVIDIFNELIEFSPELEGKSDIEIKVPIKLESFYHPVVEELVEALFLEQRRPILIFNCDEAEKIIFKLYSAFWPSMRRIFSCCTFALSPRSINGQPFDLLFTQSDLRQRFSDWPGRRIEGTSNDSRTPRHRWTKELVDRIFLKPVPSLFTNETDNLFKFQDLVDERTIRLSLLWNELLSQAEIDESPFAILGLLDIINSQPIFATDLYKNLEPFIYKTIETASKKLSTVEAWKFYSALLIKYKRKRMNRHMLFSVRNACSRLTFLDAQTAISFIANFNPAADETPSILYAGLGDGLSQIGFTLHTIFEELTPKIGLQILATSRSFAKVFMGMISENEPYWNLKLEEFLGGADKKAEKRAKDHLALFVSDIAHKNVVKLVLIGSDVALFKKTILHIGKNTEFRIREFDKVLLSEASRLNQYEYLRDTIVSVDNNDSADPLLIKLLQSDPVMMRWLIFDSRLPEFKKAMLAYETTRPLSNTVLNYISTDIELSNALIELLFDFSHDNLETLANLLMTVNISIEKTLKFLFDLPQEVLRNIHTDFIGPFLNRAFSYDTNSYKKLLSNFINKIDHFNASYLLDCAYSNKNSFQILNNIRILLDSGERVRYALSKDVVFVSRLFSDNITDPVDRKLIQDWIWLFSNTSGNESRERASVIILDFSYKCQYYDPTELLILAFPIVYKTYSIEESTTLFFSFMNFRDWDKCRTLRYDLVLRYMHSNWSRFGLFSVAYATGIFKEVVSILNDIKGGQKFIYNAIDEVKGMDISQNHPVIGEFNKWLFR